LENFINIFILIALLFSILIGYYQYYFKVISKTNHSFLLFSIRSLVFFLLLLLLINPSIPRKDLIIEKPTLSVLIDNSLSIRYLRKDSVVNRILSSFKSSEILKKNFDVNYYSFGEQFNVIDSLNFDEKQTDIYTPLSSISKNSNDANNGIILLSDGNQTIGKDYEFIKMNIPIYSIIVGDTLTYNDVRIDKINTNRYSFVNNKFPVESLLQYNGEESVKLKYTIENTGKIIYSKIINLNKEDNSRLLKIEITSKKEGLNYYKATIENLDNEKNTSNNTKEFSIEVINKQSKILIVSPFNHPDLGALKKAIESDKQRKVIIHTKNIDDINLSSYKSIIIYQPNFSFKKIINEINKSKKPYLLITGSNTDWSFINSNFTGLNKNDINTVENYRPRLNKNFLIFNQNNIGFENFPPLLDKFGETTISIHHQTLLYQNIKGFNSKEPLLAISNNNNQKKVFLFGEGIWKWRSTSYLMSNSFQNFDNFISNIVLYISSNTIKNRLDVEVKSSYNANSSININAFFVDENYKFDDRAIIYFTLKNKNSKKTTTFPFLLSKKSYKLSLSPIEPGEYEYSINVKNQNFSKKGFFKVNEFDIERQFNNVDHSKLKELTNKTRGAYYFENNYNELIPDLLNDKRFSSVQKIKINYDQLINWKWGLIVILSLLSIEWFIRKYYGQI